MRVLGGLHFGSLILKSEERQYVKGLMFFPSDFQILSNLAIPNVQSFFHCSLNSACINQMKEINCERYQYSLKIE